MEQEHLREAEGISNSAPKSQEAVPAEAVLAQMERILASELFRSSQRYSKLLRYIVHCSVQGSVADLKERIIGIEVFGRTPDYDTSANPTVRVAMNEVRKRIAQYYSLPEHAQEIQIDIPVGTYVASSIRVAPMASAESRTPETASAAGVQNGRPRRARWVLAVVAMTTLVLVGGGYFKFMEPRLTADPLWRPLISSSGPVLICIGSSPEKGANPPDGNQIQPPSETAENLLGDEVLRVGMVDVRSAEEVAEFLHTQRKESQIHPTQGTDLSDAKYNSMVLFGRYLNEWNARLHSDLHYRMYSQAESKDRWIEDVTHPQDRSYAIHIMSGDESVGTDYALITRVQDATSGHWILGVAGLTGDGTRALTRLLTDPKSLRMIEAKLPKGWEKKNLQIVMEIHIVKKVLGTTQFMSYAVW